MTTPSDAGFRRLHPATLPLRFLHYVRVLILPALFVLFAARDSGWEIPAMMFIVPAAIYEVFKYLTLRYRLDDDEMIVKVGVLFRNERHIPYARIQNIDLVQGPLQRLLKVTEAKVETASGPRPEAELKVISVAALEQMRQRVAAWKGRGDGAPVADGPERDAERPLLRLPVTELAKLGIVSNRALAVVAILMGVAWELDLYEKIELSWLERLTETFETRALILPAVAITVAAMLLLMIFSIAWTIVRFHGFVLSRRDDDLRIQCGLLTRHAATVPRRRVQFVSMHASLPHRWFDRVTVRIETAGGADEKQNESSLISRRWFAPMVDPGDVPDLLSNVDEAFRVDELDWQPLTRRGRARMVRKTMLLAVLYTGVGLAVAWPWGGLAGAAFGAVAVWLTRLESRYVAWAWLPRGIAFRSGVWTRKVSVTLFEKIQTVTLTRTPLDRWWDMSVIRVDTAGAGPAGHRIRIPCIESDVAERLFETLSEKTRATSLRW